MLNSNSSVSPLSFFQRPAVRRFLFIVVLCIITYLCIYQFDVKATVRGIGNLLPLLTYINRDNTANIPTTIIAMNQTQKSTTGEKTTNKIEQTTISSTQVTSALPSNESSDQFVQPKEAFVTFSNNNPTYLALLYIFLDSVHAFSTRPVMAFGIDVDLIIDLKKYPRVIKRRIKQSDCGPSVYFCKLHAIVSSNLEYGVLMETDDVVNYNIDILFEVLHVWPYPLPLSPRHPDDPHNYGHFLKQHDVPKKTTPYIHAHMIWNYRAWPFLKNLRSLLQQGHFQGSNFDETAVNVMLWKEKANHTMCKYDPYATFVEAYEMWPTVFNCTRYCRTAFVTLHGSKDAPWSRKLLEKLKACAGKPALQLQGSGGMRHINDTSVTCCEPDSKPSPIHPLLCEHPQS